MASRRIARLNEQLKREISEILRGEVKDPRVVGATVTRVDVTADLSLARVYVTALNEDSVEDLLRGLRAAAAFIRGEIGRRLPLRHSPELRFEVDRSLEHALRIERLLHEVLPAAEAEPPESRDPASGDGSER